MSSARAKIYNALRVNNVLGIRSTLLKGTVLIGGPKVGRLSRLMIFFGRNVPEVTGGLALLPKVFRYLQ